MPSRRAEDAPMGMLVVSAHPRAAPGEPGEREARPGSRIAVDHLTLDRQGRRKAQSPAARYADAVFVSRDDDDESGILVVDGEVRVLEADGTSALDRASRETAARQFGRRRAAAREAVLEKLVLVSEQFARLDSRDGILEALGDGAARVAGGFAALVFEPTAEGRLAMRPNATFPGLPASLPGTALGNVDAPGLYSRSALPVDPEEAAAVEPLLAATGACALACTGIGDRGLLAIVERRVDRTFESADWYALRTLARQADAALRRVDFGNRLYDLIGREEFSGQTAD